MMDTKIFLQEFNSKKSVNTSEGLNVKLKGKRKLLPTTDVSEVISQNDVYLDERKKCNKIRLTCQVNTICSNVLFNSISEIVKNEGSSGVTFLNYKVLNGKAVSETNKEVGNKVYFKSSSINDWVKNNNKTLNLTRDTQLTNDGYVYHCGKDIFNNHLIRSKTFKAICTAKDETNTEWFNTISDNMRSSEGKQIKDRVYFPVDSGMVNKGRVPTSLHMYKYDDIYTYKECIENRLITDFSGWVGFKNTAKIKTYKDFWKDEEMEINKPIMYLNGGDFVDMYPDRSLYSFVPKYNSYKNRVEKNWNYCLTYPSSSVTEGFDDIIQQENKSLKVLYFNENTIADNGTRQLVIYSISKHGLTQGDYVNIYNTVKKEDNSFETTMVIENAEVTTVVNDFIFVVFSDVQISNIWAEIPEGYEDIEANDITYTIDDSYGYYNSNDENDKTKYYIVENKYVNLDKNAQNLSYKKVVNGIECEYYIRMFSKIPNFKFASADTSNEYEIYKNDSELIKQYQKSEFDFENHVSRLAFAKNAYSDDIGEIVFTDDIDISNLKDNLGRPLSSIYLTIVKNNKGYKEWYGYDYGEDWNELMITNDSVEYSHCFGKVTCGIETCEESKFDKSINSINRITTIISDKASGYSEIVFDDNVDYYGDLCYYDGYNVVERVIQPILYRFNTAQRESISSEGGKKYFGDFFYDDIEHDDYDYEKFKLKNISTTQVIGCNNKQEGYYYNPHYEIRIKTFDKLNTAMPDFLDITSMKTIGEDKLRLSCLQYHHLSIGDKSVIYNKRDKKYYNCVTVNGGNDDNYRTYTCKVYDEDGNQIQSPFVHLSPSDVKVFKTDNLAIPTYANVIKDGTCRLIWRDILNNGFNTSDDSVEEYPFTNGAFYINKRIDLYLKRQDPYDIWGLYSPDDISGTIIYTEEEDNYVKDTEIIC